MKSRILMVFSIWIIAFISIYSQTARLQVIHNSAFVGADPVDVYLNGTLLLEDFAFRTATPFIDAPAGVELNIGVALPNTSVDDTLKNFTVMLDEGETYVAIANGLVDATSYAANPDGRNVSFDLFIKAMARESALSSNVEFFVLHGATDAPTVDVIAREASLTLVDDAAYGDITGYIEVPPAAYTLDLTLADGTTLVQSYIADLSGLGGGSAVVFASGFLTPSANNDGEAFGIFAALTNGTVVQFHPGVVTSQTARLQVIHNAADIAADPVDVYLNGTLLLEDFAFRTATPFIDAPAGVELNIGVALPNTSVDDILKNFTVMLDEGETYVAIANGLVDATSYASNPDGRSVSFDLFIKAMARESAVSSNVEFFVLHGATDAPTVDVIAREASLTLVDDAAYGDITGYIEVPAAAYTLDLTLADGTTLVQSYVADLSGLGGGSAVVFASGFLTPSTNNDGEAFGIFAALANGTVVQFHPGIVSDINELSISLPNEFSLNQNYPNPFNPSTKISFNLAVDSKVNMQVFNVLGEEVYNLLNNQLTKGSHNINFNASGLNSGVYFYKLQAKGIDGTEFSSIKKMILTK